MKKQRKSTLPGEMEESISETSTGTSQKYNLLSDKEFREEIVKMIDELKATMERTSNKLREAMDAALERSTKMIQEEMRAEISKLGTEVTQVKESVDEMKNSVGALNSRMAIAEDRISELEDELQKAYRQQQIMAKTSKWL